MRRRIVIFGGEQDIDLIGARGGALDACGDVVVTDGELANPVKIRLTLGDFVRGKPVGNVVDGKTM